MAAANSVTIGSTRVDLVTFTGDVISSELTEYTSSQRVTRSDGRTGWQYTTTYWTRFRVRGEGGKEWTLELLRKVVTVSVGQQVTLFWGVVGGKESDWLAVYNHATEHLGFVPATTNTLAGPYLYQVLLFGCGVMQFFTVFGLMRGDLLAWVMFLAFCAPWVWVFRRRETLKDAVRHAIPRPGQMQPLTSDPAPPHRQDQTEIRI